MQRSRDYFLVLRLLLLELVLVPHLCHVDIAGLDGVIWESLNEKEVVSQYAQSERLLKSVFKAVRLLNEEQTAVLCELLHVLDED